MVIHSSPGGRKKKRIIPKEDSKRNVTPIVPEKNIAIKEPVVKVEEPAIVPVVDDPTAEEFIATLPKKQNRKKVTKIIEE